MCVRKPNFLIPDHIFSLGTKQEAEEEEKRVIGDDDEDDSDELGDKLDKCDSLPNKVSIYLHGTVSRGFPKRNRA